MKNKQEIILDFKNLIAAVKARGYTYKDFIDLINKVPDEVDAFKLSAVDSPNFSLLYAKIAHYICGRDTLTNIEKRRLYFEIKALL
jgi:hypothetical protein